MSKADEMFEFLGYYLDTENKNILILVNDNYEQIKFNKIDKEFYKAYHDEYCYITMQELQAINEKCKELRMDGGIDYFRKRCNNE